MWSLHFAFSQVVGSTFQQLEAPSPRSYIGSGKVLEIMESVQQTGANTVIFDDELSPGQQRTLERMFDKMLGTEDAVRVCDRTALILDIFAQRAATHEGQLQVRRHTRALSKYLQLANA